MYNAVKGGPSKMKIFLAYVIYVAILFIGIFNCSDVYAIPPVCSEGTANIAASDTAITFGGTFSHVIIKTSSSAAIIYVDPNNNTATSADFQIDPGGGFSFGMSNNLPGITGFHYLGASATGTISWMAW